MALYVIKQHGKSLWIETIPNDRAARLPVETYHTIQEARDRLSELRAPQKKNEITYHGERDAAPDSYSRWHPVERPAAAGRDDVPDEE